MLSGGGKGRGANGFTNLVHRESLLKLPVPDEQPLVIGITNRDKILHVRAKNDLLNTKAMTSQHSNRHLGVAVQLPDRNLRRFARKSDELTIRREGDGGNWLMTRGQKVLDDFVQLHIVHIRNSTGRIDKIS